MRVPQVKERVKESPASALRAMFAGIGSMLFVKDKIRHRADAKNSTPETAAAAPESTITPETVAAEAPAAPETVPAEAAAAPQVSTGPETAAPEAAVALPLANYDELTIA